MIGKIKGVIDSVEDDSVIVDVGGVGYILYCTPNTLTNLHSGSSASFYTHMVVKEDQLTLYGFILPEEKHWFNLLQTVQGVGPRMALSVIGAISPNDIATAIISEDHSLFKGVSGVGPKLAARIVNELKGKKGIFETLSINTKISSHPKAANSNSMSDAVSALTNLGFQRKDVYLLVSEIQSENTDISLEDTIKIALSKLTPS
jgi:Holliday junction DNA helicase RuvA